MGAAKHFIDVGIRAEGDAAGRRVDRTAHVGGRDVYAAVDVTKVTFNVGPVVDVK